MQAGPSAERALRRGCFQRARVGPPPKGASYPVERRHWEAGQVAACSGLQLPSRPGCPAEPSVWKVRSTCLPPHGRQPRERFLGHTWA